MKLRIYKMLGEGFVVAEELERTKENVFVKYPAVLKMFPTQKQGEIVFKFVDLVPEFFEDFEKLIKKFPLKRHLVYMTARPNQTVRDWYGQYLKDLTKKMMNIDIVSADVLKNLPKPPGRN